MADFNGKPMIQRVIETTDGIFARRVVVTRHSDVAELCRDMGVDVILHDLPYRSDTVRLGIEAMDGMDGCLFCPGDQPLLRKETVESLALSFVNDGENIWRARHEEQMGSPVLFPEWAYELLKSLPEGKGGGYVAAQYPGKVRTIPVQDGFELMDADNREEFKRLLEIYRKTYR
jgi:molybdenum cofactor cytidylyltransferase